MKARWARALGGLSIGAVAALVPARAHAAGSLRTRTRVVVLDDGEKVNRDRARPLGESPWPAGPIELFALRGETLGLQAVIEAGDEAVDDARAIVEPFVAEDGTRAIIDVEKLVERFIVVERPTWNDRSSETLAFTGKSAPGTQFVGAIADPLVPEALERARAAPHERAAIWIDLAVPDDARPGVYRSELLVRDARGELDARAVELRVLDARLPFAAAPAFVFYETRELVRRMGSAAAELPLRELLHAHHVSAIHDLRRETLGDERVLALDRTAVQGTAFARDHGYLGPGQGIGEGVLALGAYGILGAPSEAGRDAAAGLVRAILGDRPTDTATFLYSIDETCGSDWPARWLELLRRGGSGQDPLRGVRVGQTCGREPSSLAADLVMQTGPDLDPARARFAEEGPEHKWVWAYNGMRPAAGPMMLDVPATDLRANPWIAMRYGIARWFYWESTFWFDDNAGGAGGPFGFDPFVVAETFHNKDGDHANGDGILVYPGRQRAPGMTDYGVSTVFPSVRLKNLRRGIEDSGYVALARNVDRARADAVVRRVIPRALARAGERPSWPQRARPWLDARRELAAILIAAEEAHGLPDAREDANGDGHGDGNGDEDRDGGEAVSESCSIASARGRFRRESSAPSWVALMLLGGMVFPLRRFSRPQRRTAASMATTRKREESPPSTKPEGHRQSGMRVPTPASSGSARTKPTPSEVATLPPPPAKPSGIRAKRRTVRPPSATVDEVVADLSNDPRREDD